MNRWTSVLFTPGTRPERVQKAWTTGAADVVVMDLEDAVALHDKDAARADAVRLLQDPPGPCARAVRINVADTPLGREDLDAVLPAMPEVLVLPKAERPEHVARVAARIEAEGGPTRLMLVLETALGVLRAPELASVEGVAAVAFGAEDLAADAGMRRTLDNHEVSVPRSLVALAAAAARKPAIDMVTVDLADLGRFTREAQEARGLGYVGKMCIHPSQVAAAREAFAPTSEERLWAQRVVDGSRAGGVAVVDGRMVDAPLVRQAQRILDH